MRDQPEAHDVEPTGTEQTFAENEQFPLTFRSLFFWLIVVVLGLLGTCVVIGIILALTRGS